MKPAPIEEAKYWGPGLVVAVSWEIVRVQELLGLVVVHVRE
jgi:hypothetical protein